MSLDVVPGSWVHVVSGSGSTCSTGGVVIHVVLGSGCKCSTGGVGIYVVQGYTGYM